MKRIHANHVWGLWARQVSQITRPPASPVDEVDFFVNPLWGCFEMEIFKENFLDL